MKIKAYLNPKCGWSNGVRSILAKHQLSYEEIDIIGNPSKFAEMVEKSGQSFSPCIEINGVMLADVSGEEVEKYILANDLIISNIGAPVTGNPSAPLTSETIRFF